MLRLPPLIFRCPRRSAMEEIADTEIWPPHYVLVPMGRRESFRLYDAPKNMKVPWLTGPEIQYSVILKEQGPHNNGFFFASGGQQGVSYMLDGKDLR